MSTHDAAPARVPDGGSRRLPLRRLAAIAAAASLLPALLLGVPAEAARRTVEPDAVSTAPTAAAPAGFVDEVLVTGLNHPTSIVFAPNGRVFVSEKRGMVWTWANLASFERNDAAVLALDIRPDVMNYWDRGLLGLAVDPAFPGTPKLYLLYTYDALPGGTAPHWNTGDPDGEQCVNPPGSTIDGCVVTSRLDSVTVDGATGVMTSRSQLLVGWCQQFPSHSAGSVVFGPDGMLYVSGGDGASFNLGAQDYGQLGGTQPNTTSPVTPRNPCGDPPAVVGGAMTAPTAEGGALRAQGFRRPTTESAVLNGAILRLDPATGLAAAGNAAIGNADPIRRRIVAYGLRNPFRLAFRPGTSDLYIGDVGYSTWEEINRLPNPLAAPTNFGWPCTEGPETATYYTSASLALCTTLADASVTRPLYDYSQYEHMAPSDGCPPLGTASRAGASISGLAFASDPSYPPLYRGALFAADFSRNCIVVLPAGGDGVPTTSPVKFLSSAVGPVMLTPDPNGDIVYVAFDAGEIHRIRYQPPVAAFTANPTSGTSPLLVQFDAATSSAPAGIATYDWDFGDGTAHGSGVTVQHTYAGGTVTARLTITDANGATATATRTIAANNTPPTVTLDAPTCTTACWKVNDVIALRAHAADTEQGALPASAFSWHVGLMHCHGASDCHEHDLIDPTGVSSTSVVAPDHDPGSFLRITVTATDAGGLTDTATIDVAPRMSTLAVTSSPAGLPVTIDGVTANGSVGPVDAVVGHRAVIAAAAAVITGEDRWSFSSWSDGGAISHTALAGETARTITATYTRTRTDLSNTCASAPLVTPSATWQASRFGSAGDVDWIRFKVTATTRYRMVLGNLPVDARLDLYAGCSTLIASSNQAGRHWEEFIAALAPGTYAVKMTSLAASAATIDHQWVLQPLAAGVALLSAQSAPAAAGTVRLVGEVMNTSSTTRAITVTARFYSTSGKLLKTVASATQLRSVARLGRTAFLIVTSRPTGTATIRYSLSSAAASSATRLLSATGVQASAPSAGAWKVTGSIRNGGTSTAGDVRYLVTIFDAWGRVLNTTSGAPSRTTLGAGQSATFSTAFGQLLTAPTGTSVRGKAR